MRSDKPDKPNAVRKFRRDKLAFRTLNDLDGRTIAARRAHDLVRGITQDLGGDDQCTVAVTQLVQRAAILGAYLEDAEVRFVSGQPIEVDSYLSAVNVQRRVLTTLGLQRRAKPVESLNDYVARKYGKEAVQDEGVDE